MDCPRCQKPLPASFAVFTSTERVMRGKNEKCPHCDEVLWIPFEGAPDVVVRIVENHIAAMIAAENRRAFRALSLPH